MAVADGAAEVLLLLERRLGAAADFVAAVPDVYPALLEVPEALPRALVTTGIGTSEGHARHCAEWASRGFGQPARFASTGSLALGAPPEAERDWLVVFSQGLSPNARYALQHPSAWGGVVLVTGVPGADRPGFADLDASKREWLEWLDGQGVVRVDLGCGTEYGALLRVVGARVGYAAAWSVLRSLATRRLQSLDSLEIHPDALRSAQATARTTARRVFPEPQPVAPFFADDRALLIVSESGQLELATQLSLKIAEGMLRPAPQCVDVLEFAHGPLQSHARRATSILYLAGPSTAWLETLRSTLDPSRQDLRVLEATLSLPFAVVEWEAMFDDLVLRVIAERSLDLSDWPGKDREAPLYARTPNASDRVSRAREADARPPAISLERAVWPEVEAALASGRDSALIALGSIEQHGPHLPLGTDYWIADALVRGLAQRIDEAVALPALPLGCASEHLDFPGTLHVEPATLEAILGDLFDSLARHGFTRAFLFTAHGGNVDALDSMRARLARRAVPVELAVESDLANVARMQAAAVFREGIPEEAAGPHAGEFETSLVAALRPGAVRHARLAPGRIAAADEAQGLFHPSLRAHAPDGVVGDPSDASAERGRAYLEAWIDLLEASYRAAFVAGIEKNRQ